MKMNYYSAKVFVRHCFADIRINDVPLFRRSVDADLYAEMPINYFIEFTGEQEISVQLYPKQGQISLLSDAMCKVEIWCNDGSSSKIIPIGQICTSSISVDEKDKLIPFRKDIQTFFADVSHHIIRWSDCEVIRDSENIAPTVATFYREIGRLLANKQYSKYMDYVRDREINICTALSLGEEEVSKRNQMLFRYLDDGFVLQPLTNNEKIHFYANRRLVMLLDNDMKSALRFINTDTDEVLTIELLLGIKKGESCFRII